MSQIDRSLKAFENTTEWADLIAALDKLNKVLLAHMKYPIIPRRIVISKRLQQCMHHALPSGVHLKALATYDVIFKCMGTNRLAQELFLYSAGIFPLLGNAAMNVRPTLLTVYETHFVPLGERLRPALNGLLAGVLLGLEEGSDHFERTNKLLESICEAVQPTLFYGSLWECIASNASIRLPAITFILQHVQKKLPLSEQSYIFGSDLDVVVTAVCSSVQDSKILVQRNALDFLILAFPMDIDLAKQGFCDNDRIELTVAGVYVLLRRDMSLNRRLFNWLLGSDVPAVQYNPNPKQLNHSDSVVSQESVGVEDSNIYFNYHSRRLLVDALKIILSRSLDVNSDHAMTDQVSSNHIGPNLKPYRLLTALLDKNEIGPVVIEDVIIDVFRTLFHSYNRLRLNIDREKNNNESDKKTVSSAYLPTRRFTGSQVENEKRCNELIKTANLMFGIFDSHFIWEFCGSQFQKTSCQTYRISDNHEIAVNNVGSPETTVVEMCAITDFLLDIVSLETYPETYSKHLPRLFKTITTVLNTKCNHLMPQELTTALNLSIKILSKTQPPWNAWNADEIGHKESFKTLCSDQTITDNQNDTAEITEFEKDRIDTNVSDKQTQPEEIADEANEYLTTKQRIQNSSQASDFASNIHHEHEALMNECITTYEKFYVNFLKQKIFDKKFDPQMLVNKMMRRPHDSVEARTQDLESLLMEGKIVSFSACNLSLLIIPSLPQLISLYLSISDDAKSPGHQLISKNKKNTSDVQDEDLIDYLRSNEVCLQEGMVFRLNEALRCSSRILIELSSLPTVSIIHSQAEFQERSCDKTETDTSASKLKNDNDLCKQSDIPEWLQCLLICSCLLSAEYAELQLESINTLLEMVDLLDSGIEQRKQQSSCTIESQIKSNNTNQAFGPNHFIIVMRPMIKESAYKFIFKQTVAPQVIAAKLWDGLGAMRPVHHLACVKQLHRLHNIAPDPTSIERIVARTLGHGVMHSSEIKYEGYGPNEDLKMKRYTGANTVDAFQRFTLFWHLSRDQQNKKSKAREGVRTFDVCLLKMLDNLNMSSGPLKTLSQSWLIHAMARGDIARIMEPLFLTLLDPTTARVSVLHCRIDQSNTINISSNLDDSNLESDSGCATDMTHKIFTIATSHGVYYHVSEKPSTDCNFSIDEKANIKTSTNQLKPIFNHGSERAMHLFALNSINNDRTGVVHKAWSSSLLNQDMNNIENQEGKYDSIPSLSVDSRLIPEEFPQIPLLVNPFALVPPNIDEYDSFTKGYSTDSLTNYLPEAIKTNPKNKPPTNLSKPNVISNRNSSEYESSESNANSSSLVASSNGSTNDVSSHYSSSDCSTPMNANIPNSLINDIEELEGFPSEMSSVPTNQTLTKSKSDETSQFTSADSEAVAIGILNNVINNAVLNAKKEIKPSLSVGGCATGPSSFDNISLNEYSSTTSLNNGTRKVEARDSVMNVHPLHSHILLYTQVSDSKQVLYSMQCVKNMLQTNPRLAIGSLSTTSLNSSSNSARSYQIQTLLARHRKSVFGRSFAGDLASENMATYRNSTLIEVLISTALYYLRSYYPNMGRVHLREEDIQGNREVQLMSIDIMVVLVSELILVVRDNGHPYATYISDLFARCKVQKVVLHCLLAGVNDMKRGGHTKTSLDPNRHDPGANESSVGFTEDILRFNEINSLPESISYTGTCEKISNYSEAFQVQILRLLLSLVMLEQIIAQQKVLSASDNATSPSSTGYSSKASPFPRGGSQPLVLRYLHDQPIPDQPMFLASIIAALRHDKMRHLHPHWTSLVNSCLPFLGKNLSSTVVEVTSQLCRNLEKLAPFYDGNTAMHVGINSNRKKSCDEHLTDEEQQEREEAEKDGNLGHIPADYIVTQLEALTVITHYCLLDSSAQVNISSSQPSGISNNGSVSGMTTVNSSNPASGDILNNLLHVFISHNDAKNLVASSLRGASSTDFIQSARKNLLSTLPRLVASCATLWASLQPYLNNTNDVRTSCSSSSSAFLVGDPRAVRHKVLDLLSPVAHNHPVPFLSAISVAWQERRTPNTVGMVRRPLPTCNEKQSVLVDLVISIRTMPVATVIQTVRQVLKTPPSITGHSGGSSGSGGKINVEISVLQFFHFYLSRCSPSKIADLWPDLATLLKDCLALAPSAIFLAMAILDRYVQRSSQQRDAQKVGGADGHSKAEISRKESKELQELAGKLVDECARIGGSCLEQTTWLRRNMAVRHDLQTIGDNQEDMDLSETSTKLSGNHVEIVNFQEY